MDGWMEDRRVTRSGSLEMRLRPLCVFTPCVGPLTWPMCDKWLQNWLWLCAVVSHLCIPRTPVLCETDVKGQIESPFPLLHQTLTTAASGDDGCTYIQDVKSGALWLSHWSVWHLAPFLDIWLLALLPHTVSSGVVILPAFLHHGGSHEGRMVCSSQWVSRAMSATC